MALRSAVPFLLLALAGCGGGAAAPMTMEAHMKDMGTLITSTRSDFDAHKTAVHGAADLPGILTLEASHATKMTTQTTALGTSVTEMNHCTKDGKAPDTAMMSDTLAKLKAEDTAHHTAMEGVATLAAAHTEEDRHQAAIAGHMDMMKTDQAAMMGTAAGFTCTMSH